MAETIAPILHQLLTRNYVGQNATAFEKDHGGKDTQLQSQYDYAPSFAAAVFFLAIYAILTAINVVQYVWYRAWFWWPMMGAVICMLPILQCNISIPAFQTILSICPSFPYPMINELFPKQWN